jgi:hypothetical protein
MTSRGGEPLDNFYMGGYALVHFLLCPDNSTRLPSSIIVLRDAIHSGTLHYDNRTVPAFVGLNSDRPGGAER